MNLFIRQTNWTSSKDFWATYMLTQIATVRFVSFGKLILIVFIIEEDYQQVTCSIKINRIFVLISYIYAKCEELLREDIWDKLGNISDNYNMSWLVSGDFNCIVDLVEK